MNGITGSDRVDQLASPTEKFDLTQHFVGCEAVMNQKQSRKDLIDRTTSSPTVRYAAMFTASCLQS